MLDPIVMATLVGLTLGYSLGRIERRMAANHQPPTTNLDQVARRVGLRPHEPTPVEVEQHIRTIIDCPWPIEED